VIIFYISFWWRRVLTAKAARYSYGLEQQQQQLQLRGEEK